MSTADGALNAEDHAGIAALIAHAATPRAACIDALKLVQSRHRYISDSALGEIAQLLNMSTAELDEVATFYNLIFRRPVGQHVILLCDSIACWMLGRDKLRAHITARLGINACETSKNGKFTLLPIVCLGACDQAPVLMLGDTLHGNVTASHLDSLLDTA